MKRPRQTPLSTTERFFVVCLVGIGLSVFGICAALSDPTPTPSGGTQHWSSADWAQYDDWVSRQNWPRSELEDKIIAFLFFSILFWSVIGLPFLFHSLWKERLSRAQRNHRSYFYPDWNR